MKYLNSLVFSLLVAFTAVPLVEAQEALPVEESVTTEPPVAPAAAESAPVDDAVAAEEPAVTAEPVEVGGNAATSGSLAVGEPRISTIDFVSDTDWFAVTMSPGQRYQVDLRSATDLGDGLDDPQVFLFDADGTLLASDDDGGGNLNSRLTYGVDAEQTVYVSAAGVDDSVGRYVLLVSVQVAPEEILIGDVVTGSIGPASEPNTYAVALNADDVVQISLRGEPSGGGTLPDPALRLLLPDGQQVADNDDSGGTLDSLIVFTPPETSTYIIETRAVSGIGSYTLEVGLHEPPANEIGDTAETAATLELGMSVQSEIDVPGDRDWFAIELEAGRTYTFTLRGAPTADGSLGDTLLTLLNADGQQIIQNDDDGETTNSSITHAVTDSGRYFLAVAGFGEGTGSYTLAATVETAPAGDSIRIIVHLTDGERVTLRLPRNFLSSVDAITIGPDLEDTP